MATTSSCAWSWGYVILLSRFILLFVESGIAKSFGVLTPMMVERLNSNYATVGLICSMPSALVYLFFPFVTLILQKFNVRSVAMTGGVLSGSCILACAFIINTTALGICLALSGVGLSMALVPTIMALNDFFPEKFVLMDIIATYGFTAGFMLLPIITEKSLEAYGYSGAFVILGGMSFNIVVCGATLCRSSRNVVTNAESEKHQEHNERECLIEGDGSTQHGEKICQEENSNDDDTTDDMIKQKYLIKNQTQRNHLPSDLTHESSRDTCHSLVGTCARSCRIFKEPLFLFSLPLHFLLHFVMYSWMFFLVPHAEHLGIPESQAVFLSTIGGIGGVIGRTFFVILVGKGIDLFIIYIIAGVICTLSFLIDFVSSAYQVRAVLAFLQGFCFFIEDTLSSAICKKMVFEDRNFEVAYGIVGFLTGLGSACSGVLSGYLFDITQSFTKVFIINGFILAVVVIHLIMMTISLKKRKQTSFID